MNINGKHHSSWGKFLKLAVALLIFVAGYALRGFRTAEPHAPDGHGTGEPSVQTADLWTCSMHPQIRQPKPGQCPICFMDLIPVESHGAGIGPREIELSSTARKLAGVVTAPAEHRSVTVEVRLTGKVQLDETRVASISTRVPGRIDRLFVNYTGASVNAGDPLADLYSPELVSAQQELLQAAKQPGGASSPLLTATRERLRLWGLSAEQIAGIERDGKVQEHVTFTAPIGGIVVEKEALEGNYVETGMRLFTVADLSHVWVQLDAYESDLAWLNMGQEVKLDVEAFPGEPFKGTVAFIAPLVDPATRTVRVRVEAANSDGRLKPEMFVRAVVQAKVGAEGSALPLVIPATAPLITGPRAIVYVADPIREGVFEGREVILGPRAGAFYVVREGLQEGEQVVVQGAFKIDSSVQIQGKPSMMAPEKIIPPTKPAPLEIPPPEAFRKQLGDVLTQVLEMADALARDNLEDALLSATQAQQALESVDRTILDEKAHPHWMQALPPLKKTLVQMKSAKDMETFRTAFAVLSPEMARVIKTFGPIGAVPIHEIRCPMAFNNQGATWLQMDTKVRNPYFGKAMLACGEVVATIPPEGGPPHE